MVWSPCNIMSVGSPVCILLLLLMVYLMHCYLACKLFSLHIILAGTLKLAMCLVPYAVTLLRCKLMPYPAGHHLFGLTG